jgi:DNA-binding response OmpR family regulator
MRILIIEDDEQTRILMEEPLTGAGYEVRANEHLASQIGEASPDNST